MNPGPAPSSGQAWRAAILVAEDDPASAQFFQAALESSGYDVAIHDDGQAALMQARQRRFGLLLLDCHMPGATAMQILAGLRAEPDAASHAAPAIATSAELDAPLRLCLQQAGFADVLSKPVTVDALLAAVEALLPRDSKLPRPFLDNRAALESSGSQAVVNALRGLFAGELRRLAGEWDALAAQPALLAERLHRLLASCGFCGADALAEACRRLKQELEHGGAPVPAELQHFRQTLALTLEAIERRGVRDGDEA